MLGRLLNKDEGGNEVDLALYESMLPFLKDLPMQYRHQGRIAERTGNTPDYVSPGGAYLTGSNEWIFISGTGDRVFKRLMITIGRTDLAEAPEYQRNADRVMHRPVLDAAIGAWLRQRTTDEALAEMQAADVPAIKIQSMADLMAHPQVAARQNFLGVTDEDYGEVCVIAPVPRLARMAASVRFPGQRLGASTLDVLQGELNLSADELEQLRRRRVIG